jgi:hypothetical protein
VPEEKRVAQRYNHKAGAWTTVADRQRQSDMEATEALDVVVGAMRSPLGQVIALAHDGRSDKKAKAVLKREGWI